MVRPWTTLTGLLLAASLMLTAPAAEASEAAGPSPVLIIGAPAAVGLTLNILAGVAELKREDGGYMKPGLIAVQFVAGGLDVGAGTFVAFALGDQGGEFSAIPFAFGALWLGLGTYHVVHNKRAGPTPRRPNYRPQPYGGPTRDGGLHRRTESTLLKAFRIGLSVARTRPRDRKGEKTA